MYRRNLRQRPVAEVVAEYASFKGKVIIFWDDNIAADLDYAKDLFRAITPYRKWWSSQASIHAGRDDEFLEAAARSGCKQLFLGLESISQASMAEVNKGFNRVEEYLRIIQRIHSHGIAVQAGIVFGFDHDTPAIFEHDGRPPGGGRCPECHLQHPDAFSGHASFPAAGGRGPHSHS